MGRWIRGQILNMPGTVNVRQPCHPANREHFQRYVFVHNDEMANL